MGATLIFHVVPGSNYDKLLDQIVKNSSCDLEVVFLTKGHTDNIKTIIQKNQKYSELDAKPNHILRPLLFFYDQSKSLSKGVVFLHSFYPSMLVCLRWFFRNLEFVPVRHHNQINIILRNTKAGLIDMLVLFIAQNIVAVSESVKATINRSIKKPPTVHVIPNGIGEELVRLNKPQTRFDSSFRILCVGRIDPQKNYSFVLELAEELRLKLKNQKFLIEVYGTGNTGAVLELEHKIRTRGLENLVICKGWIENIQKEFLSADALLHVAIDEACPVVIIEALVLGLPIVSSDSGGLSDVLDGFYKPIKGFKAEDYVNMLIDMIENPRYYREIAESNRYKASQKFSGAKMSQGYCALASMLMPRQTK